MRPTCPASLPHGQDLRATFESLLHSTWMNITFYFAEGCWVCDSIRETLNGLQEKYGLDIQNVNIGDNDETYDLYRFDVPVLEFEDGSALHGRIRRKDLMAKLEYFRKRPPVSPEAGK